MTYAELEEIYVAISLRFAETFPRIEQTLESDGFARGLGKIKATANFYNSNGGLLYSISQETKEL
jgi:hypothetical protein